MPANPSTSEMGRRHEETAAGALGAVRSVASGSKWQNPADGRSPHDSPYALAFDCKSTRSKSIGITLDMIRKLREQALGEVPVLPLRWYGTDDLTEVTEDWAAVPLAFLGEVLASARAWVELEATLGEVTRDQVNELLRKASTADDLSRGLADAHRSMLEAGERMAAMRLELEGLRGGGHQGTSAGDVLVQQVPKLPWAVVAPIPERLRNGLIGSPAVNIAYYGSDGMMHLEQGREVRVQRSADDRPRVYVDGLRLRNADVHGQDGKLVTRACEDDPSIEVG